MEAREIKALHEAVYSQYHLLLQYSNRAADAAMNISKAGQVKQAYDAALRDNLYSKGCYNCAIATAHALGGIEIVRSNITESCASKVTFEFDDASSAQVKYSGVFVIC